MSGKKRAWKERVCALLLAAAMIVTWMLPNMAVTVQAAPGDSMDVVFEVTHNDVTTLDNLTIRVKEADNPYAQESMVTKDEEGIYKIALNEGITYDYAIEKQGYNPVTGQVTPSSDIPDGGVVKESLDYADIALNQNENVPIEMTVDGTTQLAVTNRAEEGAYTCESSDSGVISVAETAEGWDLTAVGKGKAQVTVTLDKGTSTEKTKVCQVNVSAKDPGDLTLSIIPDKGENTKELVCTLLGLDSKATGKVTFTVTDGTGAQIGEKAKVDVVTGVAPEYVFTTGSDDVLLTGSYTVTAHYSGDSRFTEDEASNTTEPFTKNAPLKLKGEETETTLTYGNDTGIAFPLDQDTVKDRKIDYNVRYLEDADEGCISVDSEGNITVHHAGTAVVTAKAEAQNGYIETAVEYTVTVNPGEINNLSAFKWSEKESKIYDGNRALKITGTLSDTYTVQLDVELDAADAGERSYTIDTSKSYDVTDAAGHKYYVLTDFSDLDAVRTKAEVEKRPVYVEADNVEVEYGRDFEDIKTEIEERTDLIRLADNNGADADDLNNSGYLNNDTYENLPAATLDEAYKFDAATKNVDDSVDKIVIPNLEKDGQGKPGKNYVFKFDDTKRGTLTFVKQTLSDDEILDYITVSSRSVNVVPVRDEDGKLLKIWVSPDSNLKLNVANEYRRFYDRVEVTFNEVTYNATDEGIVFEPEEASQETPLTGTIKLVKSADPNTCTCSENDPNEENKFECVILDSLSPEATFKGLGDAGVIGQVLSAITFGTFDNFDQEQYVEDVLVTDSTGSGIALKQYYIWKTGSSITDDDLTPKKIEDKVNEVNAENLWEEFSGDTVPVAIGSTVEEVENNYVVFVRTADQVGNSDVYVSNGLVIEQYLPSIELSITDEKEYYNSDVKYELSVDDLADYTSALSRIDVTVNSAGVDTTDSSEEEPYQNSYSLDLSKDGNYTLAELKELSRKAVDGVITAKENNTNNVTITVTAVDNAGNTLCEQMEELKIDVTDPRITVSYDNDNAANDIYFKDGRIMTVEFRERNIDKEYGIVFEITKDGKTEDYTVDQIRANEESLGIEVLEEDGKLISDSQEKREEKDLTDDRTCTVRLKFEEDGEYTIIPKCTDKAGNVNEPVIYTNESSKANETFVMDMTDPDINVEYYVGGDKMDTLKDAVDEASRAYFNKMITAQITVDEKNFWLDGEFSSDPKQGDFSAVTGTEAPAGTDDYTAFESADQWSYNEGEGSTALTFGKDANYTFGFTYTDLSGRSATYAPHYFTYDATPPKGTILIDEQSVWDIVWNVITFNIFKNKPCDISLTSQDATAGVASTAYYKYKCKYNLASPLTQEEVEALTDNDWIEGTSLSVSPNEQFVIYGRITDRAGNVTFLYPTSGVVADNVAPEIEVVCTNSGDARNGIFNEDVHFSVSVNDPTAGDTYSGLERVWYTVDVDGNQVDIPNNILFNSDNRVQGNKAWNGSITIPAAQFNSNDVRLQVHALDFSGNEYSSEVIPIKIDITVPTISVSYDLNSPLNDRYYNATRTATVTVTERNFDESAVRFNITNTDGTPASISGWSHSADSGVSDSATHTCYVTFAADGDYTFTLNTTDLAGNDSNYTQVDDFTIDQTDPTIQVSYDNNNDAETGYYNAERTATVTVNEHNFNAADVNAAITAALEGRSITTPRLGSWSTRGDVHTASVTFSADGDYTFDVDYTDLAGNAAADYSQDRFTVDQTAPSVEFFDIVDKSANNDVVAPGVTYSDINYTENGVEITLTGSRNSEMELDGERTSVPNGESIKMADFEHTKDMDDIYTLTAVITDRAGNETEESVTFSVNRFGSVYTLSRATQELVDDYYSNEEQDLVITETNVDTLSFNGISYVRDSSLVNLTEGKDYTVKESGSDVSWKQYQYTISKENFEKEGNYTVTIDSEDLATNVSSNQAKGCDIQFVIDKTAPTIVVTGIENGEAYRADTRDMTISVSDNFYMDQVNVYLDGKPAEGGEFNASTIQRDNGELVYSIGNANDYQTLLVRATDAAGNEAESGDYSVLVTSNLLVQYYSNKPLLIGSIIVVILIAAGCCYLVIRRQKKQK